MPKLTFQRACIYVAAMCGDVGCGGPRLRIDLHTYDTALSTTAVGEKRPGQDVATVPALLTVCRLCMQILRKSYRLEARNVFVFTVSFLVQSQKEERIVDNVFTGWL